MSDHSLEKDGIACEILAYLPEHPDARDTGEGIVRWRLSERKIMEQNKTPVKKVLSNPVKKGLLEIVEKDKEQYYRPYQKRKGREGRTYNF